jgi:hypothetical protein
MGQDVHVLFLIKSSLFVLKGGIVKGILSSTFDL